MCVLCPAASGYICSSGSKNIPSKPYDDVMMCKGKSSGVPPGDVGCL